MYIYLMFRYNKEFVDMTKEDYTIVIAEKDKIIENISLELDETKDKLESYKYFYDNMINFLNDVDIKDDTELKDFIIKAKEHKCRCSCTIDLNKKIYANESVDIKKENTEIYEPFVESNITNVIPSCNLLEIDNQYDNNVSFKEICDTPLPPVTDDEDILLNMKIKGLRKTKTHRSLENKKKLLLSKIKFNNKKYEKDVELYKLVFKENRYIIHILSYIYEKYGDDTKNKDIKSLYIDYDKNISRFTKIIKIYSYIKNKTKIFNSNYLLLYNTLDIINKDDNLDEIFTFLENNLLEDNVGNQESIETKIDEKNIKFDYNYILKNKKGFLFKEDNKFYTYNLYEQKILVDNLEGIFCNYCGYTRYNSSPCIYKNCKNRKYGDFEFQIYKKINGKELDSKYNKKYNNIHINSNLSDSSSSDDDFEDEIENLMIKKFK